MDFFHCNSCFAQPGPPKNLKFGLTSCGHSFCTDCLSINASKCKVCQSECKTLALTSDIPPNLQLYFVDAVKEIKKVIKTLLVQNKHCIMYMEEYVPQLESNFLATKSLLNKKASENDILKKRVELLMTENEQLKKENSHLKQKRTTYPAKDTPVRDYQDMFGSGNRNFGSRNISSDNKLIFKPSSKPNSFLASPPSNDSLNSQPQKMTPLAALMKNRCALRDNMRMLKPNTPGNRTSQTFVMTSKSPSLSSKGAEECSPGSWCSSLSSFKSPFMANRQTYFPKP